MAGDENPTSRHSLSVVDARHAARQTGHEPTFDAHYHQLRRQVQDWSNSIRMMTDKHHRPPLSGAWTSDRAEPTSPSSSPPLVNYSIRSQPPGPAFPLLLNPSAGHFTLNRIYGVISQVSFKFLLTYYSLTFLIYSYNSSLVACIHSSIPVL